MNAASPALAAHGDFHNAAREAALTGARKAFSRPASAASNPQAQTAPTFQLQLRNLQNQLPPPLPRKSSTSVRIAQPKRQPQIQRSNTAAVRQPVQRQLQSQSQPQPLSHVASHATILPPPQAENNNAQSDTSHGELLNRSNSKGAKLGHKKSLSQSTPTHNSDISTRPRKPSKPTELEGRALRPKLSIDPLHKHSSSAIVQSYINSSEIHSPKPIRPATSAATFEAATTQLQSDADEKWQTQSSARFQAPSKPANGVQRITPHEQDSKTVPRGRSEEIERTTSSTPSLQTQAATLRKASYNAIITPPDDTSHRIEALANAIVASHLASSRASSPAKSPLPQLRTGDKHYQNLAHFRSPNKQETRTPSPAKRMRQTLRKPAQPETDEEQYMPKARGHFHFRQHPNKHHEGDRKRWRDMITEDERKRYEGVWAANRNLFIPYTPAELASPASVDSTSEDVSGLVVRDIWGRSKLPVHVLEEVWELVDRRHLARLDREEFVVGLWLIDQRLKGRKLPTKVGSSVWQSVRGIYGLKVPKRKEQN